MWTYDMLLDEAKRAWSRQINEWRRLIGLPAIALFGIDVAA